MTHHDVVIGIDLGTTYSVMAWVDERGRPRIIPNGDAHRTTPSVIHFYDVDTYVVGEEAIKMVVIDPTNVARFVKRSMGEDDFSMEFYGRAYTPQELSAIILRKLRNDAEAHLDHPVRDAVVTVPAYFNSAQRSATTEAGRIAGLRVLSIVNEPTAAAIAYGADPSRGDSRILVFDLGGGTFDVTVMEIQNRRMRSLASDGNAELGGKDWDDRLVNHVAEQFMDRFGMDPRDDPQSYQELYERTLVAKIALSTQERAVVPVNHRGHRMVVPIDRERFDGLSRHLVDQCADTCSLVLEKARVDWDDLDEVVLVGGATRMPMIRNMLQGFGTRLHMAAVNPDECVALGAAMAAVYRHRPHHPALVAAQRASSPGAEHTDAESREGVLPPFTITEIATHPLGIVVLDKEGRQRVVELIPEGTSLPARRKGRFAYACDDMTTVQVQVTEGEGESPDEVVVIGELVLSDLPPRKRGTPIDVVYRYTRNQLLAVDVIDVQTGTRRTATLNLKGSLTRERIREARTALAQARVY